MLFFFIATAFVESGQMGGPLESNLLQTENVSALNNSQKADKP